LQRSELETAFEDILSVADAIDARNKFVLLQSQWTEISALYLQGQLSFEAYFKEKNRIVFAFLTFLDTIDVPSEGQTVLPTASFMPEIRYLNVVKKALTDFNNGKPLQLPEDPMERKYYLDTFALMIYRTFTDFKE
jgi:Effector-associated domain 11